MIKQRLTDKFKAVYPQDDSIMTAFRTQEIMDYYASGCDLSTLDLTKCVEKPTIFEFLPMKPKYNYLLPTDNTEELSQIVCWQIFKYHCVGAENATDEKGKPLITWLDGNDGKYVDDKCQDNLDNDVVKWAGELIRRKAGTAVNFYLPPATFWATHQRFLLRNVKNAPGENA